MFTFLADPVLLAGITVTSLGYNNKVSLVIGVILMVVGLVA